jgi:hypothetical protein
LTADRSLKSWGPPDENVYTQSHAIASHLPLVACQRSLRFDRRMETPIPTRRRDPDAREETWRIFYGDVRVGVIAMRSGNPTTSEPWEWRCGFYPGSNPGECTYGMAATFDEARADFEAAWRVFLSKRTEADFQAWRDERDATAQKYAAWARGKSCRRSSLTR